MKTITKILAPGASLLLLAAVAAPMVAPAQAVPAFDGKWSVVVNANNGSSCDQSYRVPINVSGGQVSYSGMFSVAASGAVDPSGRLNVQLAHGGNVVDAAGTLNGNWGRGEWTSPTLRCSGTWQAQKS